MQNPTANGIDLRRVLTDTMIEYAKKDGYLFRFYYWWHRKRISYLIDSTANQAANGPYQHLFTKTKEPEKEIKNVGNKAIDHIVLNLANSIYLSITSQWELYQKLVTNATGAPPQRNREIIQA